MRDFFLKKEVAHKNKMLDYSEMNDRDFDLLSIAKNYKI